MNFRAPETEEYVSGLFVPKAGQYATISFFYGITITMYWDDHPPPHFQARYGEDRAQIGIESLEVLAGKLPARALRLTLEWAAEHQEELALVWEQCRSKLAPMKIKPLF